MPTPKKSAPKLGADVAPLKLDKPAPLEESILTRKVDGYGKVAIADTFAGKKVTVIPHGSHVKVEEAAPALRGNGPNGEPTIKVRTLVVTIEEPI